MSYIEMAGAAKKAGSLMQITTTIKSWKDPEDSLIGKLLEISEFTGGKFDKSCKQYLFETDEGLVTTLLGGATDKQIEKEDLIDNVLIVIFKGQGELEDGRKVNKFDISVVDETGKGGK